MKKVTLTIEGMACPMCEAHMNETVRKTVRDAKKVSSSFKKGETTFLTEDNVDREQLKKAIDSTGYLLVDVKEEEFVRRGLFGIRL